MEPIAFYRTSFADRGTSTAGATGIATATQRFIEEMLSWEQHLQNLARRIAELEERLNAVIQPSVVPLTVNQVAAKYPAYSLGSLRWALFHRKTNGLDRAVIQKGRRLLLDEVRFLEWVAGERKTVAPVPQPSPHKGTIRPRRR